MQIRTDDYPDETSWELYEWEYGATYVNVRVASGGEYLQGGTLLPSEDFCIKRRSVSGAGRCYALLVLDSMDDGICCTYGNGFYKAVVGDTSEPTNYFLLEGGEFQSEDWKTFCVS
jgi:hypothetical protein